MLWQQVSLPVGSLCTVLVTGQLWGCLGLICSACCANLEIMPSVCPVCVHFKYHHLVLYSPESSALESQRFSRVGVCGLGCGMFH